jgi:glycerol transport system permease protein
MRNQTSQLRAYALLFPAMALMVLCGVVPLAIVVFYSVNDTFSGNSFLFVGTEWFAKVLSSSEFFWALGRSFGFSCLVLLVEIPLGLYVALRLPPSGKISSALIILIALPLLVPTIVVGYLWKVLTLPHAGLLFEAAHAMGLNFDMNNRFLVWFTLLLMDVWHWTSLVVLLCFAGLRAIPHEYYRAAQIDGATSWKVFRFIQLPKLKLVLLLAILLRFIDSFMIYTEAYVITRGGPGVSTTFLSHDLIQTAAIQFDLGEGGAMAVVYFTIVLVVSATFFKFIIPAKAAL